jgi:asparagine synthase (glutamine-hydrolysing)
MIARQLAKDYGSDHAEISITRDLYLSLLEDAYTLIEEPNYNISLPVYLATARHEGIHGDGNRVVLSGDGGDELFGGYPFYHEGPKYAALLTRYPHWFVRAYKYAREGMWWDFTDPLSVWLHSKLFPDGTPRELRERRGTVLAYLQESLPGSFAERTPDAIRDLMLLDRTLWLAGENFIRTDKLYMSESMEMRAPLSYEPLRAYFDARLSNADYRSSELNKPFLRKLYDGALPDYVTKRSTKTGWRAPATAWWGQTMRTRYLEILDAAPAGGTIDWRGIRDRITQAETWPGKRTHLYLSLALLSRKHGVAL